MDIYNYQVLVFDPRFENQNTIYDPLNALPDYSKLSRYFANFRLLFPFIDQLLLLFYTQNNHKTKTFHLPCFRIVYIQGALKHIMENLTLIA